MLKLLMGTDLAFYLVELLVESEHANCSQIRPALKRHPRLSDNILLAQHAQHGFWRQLLI
jgi:hypothetical protein